MAENDRVWASGSALTRAGADLVGSLLRQMARIVSLAPTCPFGGFVAVLPVHQGLGRRAGGPTGASAPPAAQLTGMISSCSPLSIVCSFCALSAARSTNVSCSQFVHSCCGSDSVL
eukprot:COSAG01_NODE_22057_length_873_cov_4.262274_1_plen_116_part_00